MNWIRGKTAFVTGGSSGIGLAISRQLLEQGASVVLIARNVERLEQACSLLEAGAKPDGSVVGVCALDVADAEAATATVPIAVERYGEPDILVNCAGVAHPDYFERLDVAVRDMTMGVNFEGVWNVTHALLPLLRRRRGCIVNVASLSGLLGSIGYSAYAASKFAVVGFSEALRNELAPDGVAVFLLCPPDTDTPQLEQENRTKPREAAALSGNAGVLTAETVARACIRGMTRRRFLIIPGRRAQLLYLAKRSAPTLLYRAMDATVRKSRRMAERLPR